MIDHPVLRSDTEDVGFGGQRIGTLGDDGRAGGFERGHELGTTVADLLERDAGAVDRTACCDDAGDDPRREQRIGVGGRLWAEPVELRGPDALRRAPQERALGRGGLELGDERADRIVVPSPSALMPADTPDTCRPSEA